MKYKHLSDCHNHSTLSHDGRADPKAQLQRAVDLRLHYYAMTDHCECERNHKDRADRAYNTMLALKEEYMGKLNFLLGIELGQPTQDISVAEAVLKDKNYDIVLGSLHNLRGREDFYFWRGEAAEVPSLLDRYFEELSELVDWGNFDSLTHITYPLRYIVGECGIELDFTKYYDRVEHIFRKIISKGIALEVNTSGLFQKIGETLPNPTLIKMYRRMGGELITIGSDAHETEHLARGIDTGFDILKNAGFKYFTVFENRKPKFITIE